MTRPYRRRASIWGLAVYLALALALVAVVYIEYVEAGDASLYPGEGATTFTAISGILEACLDFPIPKKLTE